jgi:hypothetical protein
MATGRFSMDAQLFLKGLQYPATKQDVLRTAREQHATEPVLVGLESIPDREYGEPGELVDALNRQGTT